VLKLLVIESGSDMAVEWLSSHEGEELIAPVFMFTEVASVLQRKVRMGEITAEERDHALDALESIHIRPVWDCELIERAVELADQLGQPTVYDTLYLAAAEDKQCPLLTADRTFAKVTSDMHPLVRLL